MARTATTASLSGSIEALLRQELRHADQAMIHMGPILRHLLRNDDTAIFSDEVVARVRGMFHDLSRQMVEALAKAAGDDAAKACQAEAIGDLAGMLGENQALLPHVHALAIEWQITERLQGRIALDPVLSPLLQEQIASSDPVVAELGMNLLAAQARFGQTSRRMQLPLAELPGDLHHIALMTMCTLYSDMTGGNGHAEAAEAELRMRRAEAPGRIELLSRVVENMGERAISALSLDQAGVALFATALGMGADQPREAAIMCMTENQLPRLALSLAASGADMAMMSSAFFALYPEVSLLEGIAELRPDRAAAILAGDSPEAGY